MKFAIQTLGCKVNTYESEVIRNNLLDNKLIEVPFTDIADIYIINTCTVTNQSDSKSRKYIRQATRRNPGAIICVLGCYSQVSPEEVVSIEGVNIILGNHQKNNFYNIIQNYLSNNQKKINLVENIVFEDKFEPSRVDYYVEQTRAFVKIQDGCNNFCSYCIIPYARGSMRSKDYNAIINECQKLVNTGFKEIVLTGINTGGYGEDLKDYTFGDLLFDLEKKVLGLKVLRISSIEPTQIDQKVLRFISQSKIFAKHLHIPLQSGSDNILKGMKRGYTVLEYKQLIEDIRSRCEDIAITTDIIVGFPTETDADHLESIKNIEDIAFYEMHIFPFSPRKFTQAAKLIDIVGSKKINRIKEFHSLNKKLSKEYVKKFIEKKVEFIVENKQIKIDNKTYLFGHTSQYLKALIQDNSKIKKGDLIKAKVTSTNYPFIITRKET